MIVGREYRARMPTNYYNYRDKRDNIDTYIDYMLARTQHIFSYTGLPESIPARDLEMILQTAGCAGWVKHVDGKIYALFGGFGGKRNAYYMPTEFIIANPALNIERSFVVDDDVVVMPNDSLYRGMIPLFSRYASLMVENDLTMRTYDILARVPAHISAPDDSTRAAADKYLEKIECGELAAMADSSFLDGVQVRPNGENNSRLTAFIEYQQYLKASWFNDIGLNANYNMKREAIGRGEAEKDDDILMPFVDDMLICRRNALEKINSKWGLNINVKIGGAWADNSTHVENEGGEEDAET